ncbi:MAG: peptidylprolyl isomerase, partial [Actinobacteria bacterium]|nr:peptidylprolyl isomerase [Actinomycetota bacterium]
TCLSVIVVSSKAQALSLASQIAAGASFASPSLPAGQTPPCTESGQAMLAAFPASYRDLLLRQQSDVDALLAHSAHIDVSMPALRSYYAAHRAGFATTCLSVIVVSSKAQALSLASQIAAGASFASLANADSLEAHATNPGGSVGCFPVDSSLPSELASVVDGVRSGPVSSPVSYQGDWLLFKVDSRTSPSFDQAVASEVRSQLLSGLSGSIQTMERRLIDHASVTVDSRYGRWRGAAGLAAHSNILVPPTGPPARFVPNAAANRAPVGSSS